MVSRGGIGRGPVGEQTGQVGVQGDSAALAALAAAHQERASPDVDVPPFEGDGLADAEAGPPHDEGRHAGSPQPEGRQGVQQSLDLRGRPVVGNVSHENFYAKSSHLVKPRPILAAWITRCRREQKHPARKNGHFL